MYFCVLIIIFNVYVKYNVYCWIKIFFNLQCLKILKQFYDFFLYVYCLKLNYKEKVKIIEYGFFNYYFCISIKQEEVLFLGYIDVYS